MKYCTGTLWEQGGRLENEDSIALLNVKLKGRHMLMACLADGVGGLFNSQTASSMVTFALKSAFENALRNNPDISLGKIRKKLMRELHRCHKDISKNAAKNNMLMGTTCLVICLVNRKGFIINYGDARTYHLHRLTGRAHLMTSNKLQEGMLNTCIGAGKYRRPEFKRFNMHTGDLILLCTDGFYRRQDHELKVKNSWPLGDYDLKKWLDSRYRAVRNRGEMDNSSAVIIRLERG